MKNYWIIADRQLMRLMTITENYLSFTQPSKLKRLASKSKNITLGCRIRNLLAGILRRETEPYIVSSGQIDNDQDIGIFFLDYSDLGVKLSGNRDSKHW